jgi:putative aminopeptidase FrvX
LESPGFAHAALGEGPVLRALDESGMTPRSALARINALARRNGIPLQSGVTAGGNDGSVFRSLKTVNIPLGFPLRYAHTPVETADLRDAEAAVELIELLAREQLQKR